MIDPKYFLKGFKSIKGVGSPAIALGASFIAISVDHEICNSFHKDKEFLNFKEKCSKIGTTEEALANAEKLGYDTKLLANHPFLEGKKLPIYIANFVLMDYGKGAIFGCPGLRCIRFSQQRYAHWSSNY